MINLGGIRFQYVKDGSILVPVIKKSILFLNYISKYYIMRLSLSLRDGICIQQPIKEYGQFDLVEIDKLK